jgi:hypothetical protein
MYGMTNDAERRVSIDPNTPPSPWYGDTLERLKVLLEAARPGDSAEYAEGVGNAAVKLLNQAFDSLDAIPECPTVENDR